MNYMKQVAHMLGVELGEEFKIKYSSFNKHKITERGLEYFNDYDNHWCTDPSTLIGLLFGDFEITKLPKPILDEAEKRYLSNVIKPFRDKIIEIVKYECAYHSEYEYVCIVFHDKIRCVKDCFSLPLFEKGTMYKGMELGKQYSLEDLEL